MNRPETTLFMLVSVDGKISTGDNDTMDVDKDYPKIEGVRAGLQQYYDIEQTTDLYSLNSGRVMAKMGVNDKEDEPKKSPVSFIVIDDSHLTEKGVLYLTKKCQKLFLVTANKNHPAFNTEVDNLEMINYEDKIDFINLFEKLKTNYGIEKITIQTGGTLNSILLREGLIDHLSIVMAPCLIGGKNTSTLIDGESLHSENDLLKIKPLKLIDCEKLKDSYLHLKYDVLN
ncbi:MAG: dihydrofolate reductase family protein [Candidatus Berkelbacteria bacterium]